MSPRVVVKNYKYFDPSNESKYSLRQFLDIPMNGIFRGPKRAWMKKITPNFAVEFFAGRHFSSSLTKDIFVLFVKNEDMSKIIAKKYKIDKC